MAESKELVNKPSPFELGITMVSVLCSVEANEGLALHQRRVILSVEFFDFIYLRPQTLGLLTEFIFLDSRPVK